MGNSSVALGQIISLCKEEILKRGQFCWEIIYRFLTTSGIQYEEILADELKNIFRKYFPEDIPDFDSLIRKSCGVNSLLHTQIPQAKAKIIGARNSTLTRFYGEIDLFVISLKNGEAMANSEKGSSRILHKYDINASTVIMGNNQIQNVHSQQINFDSKEINLIDLANELCKLRNFLVSKSTSPESFIEIGELAKAEIEAKKGDEKKVIESLRRVGKLTLETAKEIGVQIAATVISKSIGVS